MDNQNFQNLSSNSTVWVGNNPYLVSPSGIIPLTSGFSALSFDKPQLSADVQNNQGQYFVVSVQESPTKPTSPAQANPRTGLGLYNSSPLTTSSPNLGFNPSSDNNYNYLQLSPQPANLRYSSNPKLNQFPPTFTNGLSSLSNSRTASNNLQSDPYPHYLTTQNLQNGNSYGSYNGNVDTTAQISPTLSSSSMSMLSESSFGALPSPDRPDASLSCVYNTDPKSTDTLPSALSPPTTLPKPKRKPFSPKEYDDDTDDVEKKIYPKVLPCYDRPINKEYCLRCDKKVYQMEKLGPVKDCLYHKLCFHCVVCSTTLNLKNYHVNPNDMEDLNVYCVTHMPVNKSIHVDARSIGIKGALKVPKLDSFNQQIRGGPDAKSGSHIDSEALGIKTALNAQRKTSEGNDNTKYKGHTYNLDVESLNFQHVRNIPVQNLQTANKTRESSWTRSARHAEAMPPPNVIHHNDPIQECDHLTTRFYYSP